MRRLLWTSSACFQTCLWLKLIKDYGPEDLDASIAVRARGLARAVGLCNFSAKHLASLESLSREMPEARMAKDL